MMTSNEWLRFIHKRHVQCLMFIFHFNRVHSIWMHPFSADVKILLFDAVIVCVHHISQLLFWGCSYIFNRLLTMFKSAKSPSKFRKNAYSDFESIGIRIIVDPVIVLPFLVLQLSACICTMIFSHFLFYFLHKHKNNQTSILFSIVLHRKMNIFHSFFLQLFSHFSIHKIQMFHFIFWKYFAQDICLFSFCSSAKWPRHSSTMLCKMKESIR